MTSSRQAGFSILEVLVALAFLAVVIVVGMGLITSNMTMNVRSKDRTDITMTVRSYFEQARATYVTNFDSAAPAAPSNCTISPAGSPVSLKTSTSGSVILKRITLNCTLSSKSYTFSMDFARP
ncbi:type IV pilus modification PilV family protein [Deinococcus pimensis]|uniref:type IV pilus modification PilV family protein n=1 Tax=Deinococcus pimensis TaxID=309888 RepID=UPI0004894CC9|nr:hypothetical protein [Deinococcus pimensis]